MNYNDKQKNLISLGIFCGMVIGVVCMGIFQFYYAVPLGIIFGLLIGTIAGKLIRKK